MYKSAKIFVQTSISILVFQSFLASWLCSLKSLSELDVLFYNINLSVLQFVDIKITEFCHYIFFYFSMEGKQSFNSIQCSGNQFPQ